MGATRLQYRPVLRHLRSLTGPPTSDDERQSILLQFVRTDSDLRRQPQSRVSHSRSISYFEFTVRRRATPSGSETRSRFAFPHSLPSKGTARRPHTICRKLSANTWMCRSDLVATTTRPPKWNQAELTRLAEDAARGNERVMRSSAKATACTLEFDCGQVKSLTRTGLDWSHQYKRTIEAIRSVKVKSAHLDGEL